MPTSKPQKKSKAKDDITERMALWRFAACDLALSLTEHYQDVSRNNSLQSKSVQNIMKALSMIEQLALEDEDWVNKYQERAELIKER